MHPDKPDVELTSEVFFLRAFEVYKKHKERMMGFYGMRITFSHSMIQFWDCDYPNQLAATIHLSHKTVLQQPNKVRPRKELLEILELL